MHINDEPSLDMNTPIKPFVSRVCAFLQIVVKPWLHNPAYETSPPEVKAKTATACVEQKVPVDSVLVMLMKWRKHYEI